MCFSKENFKTVKGFDKYLISNTGVVKSKKRKVQRFSFGKDTSYWVEERVLNPFISNSGYKTIKFGSKHRYIHRLVAENFIKNENPDKNFVNHKDGNKLNNNVENLEWCTRQENHDHARKNKLISFGEKKYNASLTNENVKEIRRLAQKGFSHNELAKKFKVRSETIRRVVRRERYGLVD
jgi:hypothetical protein